MARYIIQPVNKVFSEYVSQYVEEIEGLRFTFVGTEGPGNTTYIYECDEEDPWIAVPALKSAVQRCPLANAMFCRVAPYGVIQWPPYTNKDEAH